VHAQNAENAKVETFFPKPRVQFVTLHFSLYLQLTNRKKYVNPYSFQFVINTTNNPNSHHMNPPIALTEVWLPSLPSAIKPTLIVRSRDALIAKIPTAPNLSPAALRQLTGALETFHPASAGCRELTHREIYHNPTNRCTLLVFWIPEDAPLVPHYAASTKGLRIKVRTLKPTDTPQISANYQQVAAATTHETPPAKGHKKRHGDRLRLRRARNDIAHVFPGLIKIVWDRHTGSVKSSFAATKLAAVIKHRVLYASALSKHGIETLDPDTNFQLGTWRVSVGVPKGHRKKLYHVLTLWTAPQDVEPRSIRVDFTPTWEKKILHKTDSEIDREIGEFLTNRKALIKSLGIKTTKRQ